MLLTPLMMTERLRQDPPRSPARDMVRPRPTAGAALLLAVALSLPFVALAVVQALL
ncbi:hypothetical protein [Mameliella sp.]|uniref:hypothetical protein n=1 Tax=Mameliella sp. TaxID=1924940 RepID=UPI003BABBDF9